MKIEIIGSIVNNTGEIIFACIINNKRYDNWYNHQVLEPTGNITGNESPAFLAIHGYDEA